MITFLACIPLVAIGYIGFRMNSSKMRSRDSNKFYGLLSVICVTAFILVVTSYNGLFNRPLQSIGLISELPTTALGSESTATNRVYGIMFDAGSTGSRIHVFEFIDQGPDKPAKYVTEKFVQIKGGLGEYATDPTKGAQTLVSLMEEATAYIPKHLWASTPIALKATAGLRALKEEQSNAILNEVNLLFDKYEFKKSHDSVVIMEGTDEGKFIWFTVNYLAGVLGDDANMVGVMDLGGGSTQVTLLPTAKGTIDTAPDGFLSNVDILGQQKKLYTHSYPLGLMAGRFQLLVPDAAGTTYSSPCLPEGFQGDWKFNNKDLDVKASTPSTSRYEQCYNLAKAAVAAQNIHKIEEVNTRPFWTVSYYYDRAVDSKLIDAEEGGTVTVQDYFDSATKACASPSKEMPWHCSDLTFISTLLHDGFGFNKETRVTLRKKVAGNEISWCLGAMFDWFSGHKQSQSHLQGAR